MPPRRIKEGHLIAVISMMQVENRLAVAMIRPGDHAVVRHRKDTGAKIHQGHDRRRGKLIEGNECGLCATAAICRIDPL